MKSFVAVILATFLAIALGLETEIETLSSRIVGGETAEVGAFPYHVSLRKNNKHFCSGSIINEFWIVTAAHCLRNVKGKITVYVGTNTLDKGGVAYQAAYVVLHPNYGMLYNNNDIALIKVNANIAFNEVTKAIPLPKADITKNNYPAVVSGWGLLKNIISQPPNDLQYLKTYLLDNETCKKKVFGPLSSEKICAFTSHNQGTCYGDSGGPLVADDTLVGVVSYSIVGCAMGYPDIYMRVYSFVDWIEETIKYSS